MNADLDIDMEEPVIDMPGVDDKPEIIEQTPGK